jgi:exodeoxyribonuclease VIII
MADDLTPHSPNTARAGGATAGAAVSAAAPGLCIPETGIIHDLPFEAYLAEAAVSKSGLWTLHSRSPAHARVDKEESNAMKLGTAIHCAVLEPDEFEARYVRGPDDRRGNKWKEAVELAIEDGKDCLTSGDYDAAVTIRDEIVVGNPLIRRLTSVGTVREVSAFAIDPETGLRMRARPDAFAPGLGMLVDLKVTADARQEKWFRRVLDFGYHVQEPHYTDVWRRAGGEADAFVFLVIEDKPPFAHAIYELAPPDIAEGEAIRRKALTSWAECARVGEWPGYPPGVQQLALPKWAFTLTNPEETDS